MAQIAHPFIVNMMGYTKVHGKGLGIQDVGFSGAGFEGLAAVGV